MNKFTKYMSLAAIACCAVSCTDDFEEINTDPDAYDTAPYTNILNYCLEQTANNWGMDLIFMSTWSGHNVASGYPDYYNYLSTDNEFNNKWEASYTLHEQLQDILDRTEDDPEGNKNIRNVAKVFQDFLMLFVVDCYGDIPYSQAWRGDEGILQAAYDDQADVYAALRTDLKSVADSWAEGLGDDELGDGDNLFGGDVEKWQRFCNSLRLRIAMRLVNVEEDTSRAIVEEIFANPDKYPVIDDCKDNAYQYSDGTSSYYEEWYNNYRTRPNDFGVSHIFINYLLEQEDPRISSLAQVATSTGEYVGFYNGSRNGATSGAYSLPGEMYYWDPAGFTPYYRACETYFAKAEAIMRGWNVSGTAEEAYNQGVLCSMTDNEISDADAAAYLEGKGKFDGTYSRLYHEMWTALYKESYEAWSLYRRTGYPNEIHESYVTYPNGVYNKEYPGQGLTTHNDVPFRFPYPNNEELYNLANLDSARVNVVDACWGEKLYWDTRSAEEYW